LGVAGEVGAGDLEAVEEQAGAFGVDLVVGDAAQDLADGGLDGEAVLGEGDVEAGLAAATAARVVDGAAGGVVVVAELLGAEAGAGATVSVGEDVAALVLDGGRCGGWCGGVWHGCVPSPGNACKVFKRKGLCPDLCRVQVGGLKEKARLSPGFSFFIPFKDSRLGGTDGTGGSCCLVRG
jgi:hypothetical protein